MFALTYLLGRCNPREKVSVIADGIRRRGNTERQCLNRPTQHSTQTEQALPSTGSTMAVWPLADELAVGAQYILFHVSTRRLPPIPP
jgi:hypothetical protein